MFNFHYVIYREAINFESYILVHVKMRILIKKIEGEIVSNTL